MSIAVIHYILISKAIIVFTIITKFHAKCSFKIIFEITWLKDVLFD